MKVVFAFDSLKGSLAAREACAIAARSWRGIRPEDDVVTLPLADGGEGTIDAVLAPLRGERMAVTVCGPLPSMRVDATYGWCAADRLAVIEMAEASGLTLLDEQHRNPLITTTRGTGELIRHAANSGARRIVMAVGGSATVDGGTGAARALGWQFLDERGRPVPEGGGQLERVAHVVPPEDRESLPSVEVLCDVTNPLTGPRGAARVFGPQKGADASMVEQLETGLRHLAHVVKRQTGRDIDATPGAGAAGGLAGGSIAWMNARLVPGIDRILDLLEFDTVCRDADWVMTGEGKLDHQSLQGKVVSGVIRRIRSSSRARIAVLAGKVELSPEETTAAGIDHADAITPASMPFPEARREAPRLLEEAVQRLARHLTPR